MATNAQIGDPNYGIPYTLTSISAAVLGGASLLGGRGSFLGAVGRRPVRQHDHHCSAVPRMEQLPRADRDRCADTAGAQLLPSARVGDPDPRTGVSNFKLRARLHEHSRRPRVTRRHGPLQRLLAYHEISDVIGRYCMLFDDQDWDGLAELWTDDALRIEVEDKSSRAARCCSGSCARACRRASRAST